MQIRSFAAALAATLPLVLPSASAELLIAPTRVVLEGGERSAELVLVNKGSEEAAYRISVENRRMLPSGMLEVAQSARADELFAADLVRFAPRRLIMAPGARQTVRISARAAGLEPGEYRTHLRVMAAPTSAGRSLSAFDESAADGISIELVAIRSLTLPVILRVGELDSQIEVGDARIADVDAAPKLVAKLKRRGEKSTYGDLEISVSGRPEPVYRARGIAVYTPIQERDVTLPLPRELLAELRGQEVRIAYVSSDPEAPGVIAEATTVLD